MATTLSVTMPPEGSRHGMSYKTENRCPCCASSKLDLNEYLGGSYDGPDHQYNIVCKRCGMRTGLHKTPEEAIFVWDRRDWIDKSTVTEEEYNRLREIWDKGETDE